MKAFLLNAWHWLQRKLQEAADAPAFPFDDPDPALRAEYLEQIAEQEHHRAVDKIVRDSKGTGRGKKA